jgi:hypothetical protein
MAGGSYPIRSLIQGISQQEDSSRGTANAKDQENCLNEVLDGAVSRMGTIVKANLATDYSEPFVHEINRNANEQYVVLVEGGALQIVNKVNGNVASITGSIAAYLAHTGDARKAFQAVTIGDTTFLLNRQVEVEMDSTKSAARPNQAICHFKAGGYKVTYTLKITVGSNTYTATFTTPNNSESNNAQYIVTDYLATQFETVLNATTFPAMVLAGDTGFSVTRIGSVLVISRSTSGAFDISTTDGVGDTQFISFKDNVKKITDLPAKCVDGYQVSVAGDGSAESSKYFLKFSGGEHTGRWSEVVAPDTFTDLKASTMPHLLVNTGLDTFEVKAGTWGKRLAGDGDLTAQDPSFVGTTINSLQFIGGRLGMVTSYEMTLSRSRNAYVYFPDTVQTNLDTAPVDYDVSNGSSTDITHSVAAGGKLQFWGDLQQTYLDSGQDPIREDTTEVLPLANYEFDGETSPKTVGLSSLVFGTAVGRWAKLVEVYFRQGRPDGEIEITAHVPQLLEGKVRHIGVGEASKKTFVLTKGSDNLAYLYQWYNQGNERVQSAWNKWRFEVPSKVLWASIQGATAWFLFKWPSGCTLEYVILDRHGDETDQTLPLRLDHRVSEADATYGAGKFTIALPYQVPSAKRANFKAVERTDILDVSQRGRELPFTWVNDSTVEIVSDNEDLEFFFGSIPVARRTFSTFLARDREDQPVLHDRLLVKKIVVGHYRTVEYSAIVRLNGEVRTTQTYRSRLVADPSVTNNEVAIKDGSFAIDVGEVTEEVEVELVNDTVFPAVWRSAKYLYDLTVREGQ